MRFVFLQLFLGVLLLCPATSHAACDPVIEERKLGEAGEKVFKHLQRGTPEYKGYNDITEAYYDIANKDRQASECAKLSALRERMEALRGSTDAPPLKALSCYDAPATAACNLDCEQTRWGILKEKLEKNLDYGNDAYRRYKAIADKRFFAAGESKPASERCEAMRHANNAVADIIAKEITPYENCNFSEEAERHDVLTGKAKYAKDLSENPEFKLIMRDRRDVVEKLWDEGNKPKACLELHNLNARLETLLKK